MTGQNLNFMRELEAAIVSDWPNGEANIAKEMLSDSVNPITGQIDKETYCHQLRIASRGCIEVASVYSLELTALYSESIGERLYKTSPQFTNKVEKAMKLIQDISKTEEFFGLRDYYDKKYIERGSHIFHHLCGRDFDLRLFMHCFPEEFGRLLREYETFLMTNKTSKKKSDIREKRKLRFLIGASKLNYIHFGKDKTHFKLLEAISKSPPTISTFGDSYTWDDWAKDKSQLINSQAFSDI